MDRRSWTFWDDTPNSTGTASSFYEETITPGSTAIKTEKWANLLSQNCSTHNATKTGSIMYSPASLIYVPQGSVSQNRRKFAFSFCSLFLRQKSVLWLNNKQLNLSTLNIRFINNNINRKFNKKLIFLQHNLLN